MKIVQDNISKAQAWLSDSALPLWFDLGVEKHSGAFIEWISSDGKAMPETERRAMVQARQIYSICEAVRLQLMERSKATALVSKNIELLFSKYKRPQGGYFHALNDSLQVSNESLELYTQAFILFCLAQAYDLLKDENIKTEALIQLEYLNTQRRNPTGGGFTEIKAGQTLYQSNPHMHLFEAALAWVTVDTDKRWTNLATELKDLSLSSFIDNETNLLAEHFSTPWLPVRTDGKFIFEPGHHYEWSWLYLEYQKLFKIDLLGQAKILFANAEKYGLTLDGTIAVDEVWSDLKLNKTTARFWPQGERVKAAVSLGALCTTAEEKNNYFAAADLAFVGLMSYLQTPIAGLNFDTRQADGSFKPEPAAKASSLYHIINAFSEYISKRGL